MRNYYFSNCKNIGSTNTIKLGSKDGENLPEMFQIMQEMFHFAP